LAEEQTRLLPLPAHRFETDLVVPTHAGKTIYIRFDVNDYSIPPEAVARPLTLVASESTVRILDGTQEIARHRRSYDRHQLVLDPAHPLINKRCWRKSVGPEDRLPAVAWSRPHRKARLWWMPLSLGANQLETSAG
jgi:hypothetical protein